MVTRYVNQMCHCCGAWFSWPQKYRTRHIRCDNCRRHCLVGTQRLSRGRSVPVFIHHDPPP